MQHHSLALLDKPAMPTGVLGTVLKQLPGIDDEVCISRWALAPVLSVLKIKPGLTPKRLISGVSYRTVP